MSSKIVKFLAIVLFVVAVIAFVSVNYESVTKTASVCIVRDPDQESAVTRIIHQSWKSENIPHRFRLYSQSWTGKCFRDWKYILWTDEDNYKFIAKHYHWFLGKYLSLPSNIHRADVSRYFYLFHYGGIYTDLDNECLKSFEDLLRNFTIVFGSMKGQYFGTSLSEGYVQNSFLYSRPRQKFWLELVMSIFNDDKKSSPEVQTGPILLSNALKLYLDKCKGNYMKIYPPLYFNPFSWLYKNESSPHCKDFNKMSVDDWRICKSSFVSKGSFVVQYHAHTWNY